MKIRELLTDESKWCQGLDCIGEDCSTVPYIDILNGKPTPIARWSLWGALIRHYLRDAEQYRFLFGDQGIFARVEKEFPPTQSGRQLSGLRSWLDDPARTFADVRELIERLDI